MEAMLHRSLFRLALLVAGLCLAVSSLSIAAQKDNPRHSRKYKAPAPTARIEVTILRDSNGKPIENAAVVFHPMAGERDKGVMELKTNDEGKTIIDVLPLGDTVRMQIIARGFQTYGEDFKVDKAEMAIEIKLKRPGEQYSIYKDHPEAIDPGKDKPEVPSKQQEPKQPPPSSK